jgi:hypothetical protein
MKNPGSFEPGLSVNVQGHSEAAVRQTRDRGVAIFSGNLCVWKQNGKR